MTIVYDLPIPNIMAKYLASQIAPVSTGMAGLVAAAQSSTSEDWVVQMLAHMDVLVADPDATVDGADFEFDAEVWLSLPWHAPRLRPILD